MVRAGADLDEETVRILQQLLHEHNNLVRQFKTAVENIPTDSTDNRVVIRADKRPWGEHERRYNAPVDTDIGI